MKKDDAQSKEGADMVEAPREAKKRGDARSIDGRGQEGRRRSEAKEEARKEGHEGQQEVSERTDVRKDEHAQTEKWRELKLNLSSPFDKKDFT